MNLDEVIHERRTTRVFKKEPVDKELIARVIEAAAMAPSSMNNQPWHFTVVSGKERDALVKIIGKTTLYIKDLLPNLSNELMDHFCHFIEDMGGAPVIIVMSMPGTEDEYASKINWLSCGCSLQNLQLKAWASGLGCVVLTVALWVENEIKELLGLEDKEIITVLPMGYPDETPPRTERNLDVIEWVGFD